MKEEKYYDVIRTIKALTEDETDNIAILSTVCCELYHAFDYLNWVGFYRLVDDNTLKVGPYQGSHGCLTIDIKRGVCGKCVVENKYQLENDVASLPHHIACSSETQAELVFPLRDKSGNVYAVLDVDSVEANVFDDIDLKNIQIICDHIEKLSSI